MKITDELLQDYEENWYKYKADDPNEEPVTNIQTENPFDRYQGMNKAQKFSRMNKQDQFLAIEHFNYEPQYFDYINLDKQCL